MRRARLKYGIYQSRSILTEQVVLLTGPDGVWAQFNGTNYPAVLYRKFNAPNDVKRVLTEQQFRDRFKYVGKYQTVHKTMEEAI
jgi:hypothetical protein